MSPVAIAVLVLGFALMALLSFMPRRKEDAPAAAQLPDEAPSPGRHTASRGSSAEDSARKARKAHKGASRRQDDPWLPGALIGHEGELPDAPHVLEIEVVEDAPAARGPESRRTVVRVAGARILLDLWVDHDRADDDEARPMRVGFATDGSGDEARVAEAIVSWLDAPAPPPLPGTLAAHTLDGAPAVYLGMAYDPARGEVRVIRLNLGCYEESPVWLLLGAGEARWAELRHGLGPDYAIDAAFALDALARWGTIPDDAWRARAGAPIIEGVEGRLHGPQDMLATLATRGRTAWGVIMDYDTMRADLLRWSAPDTTCARLGQIDAYVSDLLPIDGGERVLMLEERAGIVMVVVRDGLTLEEIQILHKSAPGQTPAGAGMIASEDGRWLAWLTTPDDDDDDDDEDEDEDARFGDEDDEGDEDEDEAPTIQTLTVLDRTFGEARQWQTTAFVERLQFDDDALWFAAAWEDEGKIVSMRWDRHQRAPERADHVLWASSPRVRIWREPYALVIEPRDQSATAPATITVPLSDLDMLAATSALSNTAEPVRWITPDLLYFSEIDSLALDVRTGELRPIFGEDISPFEVFIGDELLVWNTSDDEVFCASIPGRDEASEAPPGTAW